MSKLELAHKWRLDAAKLRRQARESKTNESYRENIRAAFAIERKIAELLKGEESV